MAKLRLTKRVVESLGPRQAVWDCDLMGFGARRQVRHVFFVVKVSINRKQTYVTIGKFGPLTVDQARAAAKRVIGRAAEGIDPRAQPPMEAKAAVTVAELSSLYLSVGPSFKPSKQFSSWRTDESNIRSHILPILGSRRARDITETDVAAFVTAVSSGATRDDKKTGLRGRAIVRGGKGTASRSLAVLSAIFAFGVRTGRVASNPAHRVKAYKGAQPGRYLTREEWARLGDVLRRHETEANPAFVAAIRVLALTGCRRSEITRLRWDELDLEKGVIRLSESKVGARVVPLGEQAVRVFRELKATQTSPWVFPSTRGVGPIVGIQKVWAYLRQKAKLPGVRLHDLRHSFASEAVSSGASLYLTGAILGHRQPRTTQRYAHLQADSVRQIATLAAEEISTALCGAK
jgi:integrase